MSVELTFAFVVSFSNIFAFFMFNGENNLQMFTVLTSVHLKKAPTDITFLNINSKLETRKEKKYTLFIRKFWRIYRSWSLWIFMNILRINSRLRFWKEYNFVCWIKPCKNIHMNIFSQIRISSLSQKIEYCYQKKSQLQEAERSFA